LEQNRYLGIYIAPGRATVVLVGKTGQKIEILQQFCVTAESGQENQPQPFTFAKTAEAIASACAEKQLVFSDVAVAIDCRLYRQQKLHSEFQEYRQITQTIRFDAEEALAVDAAQTAIAFEIAGKQPSGSDVSTFAAPAAVMSEIIVALQNKKLDPVTIEPDSICFRRIIEDAKQDSIVVAVSQTRCFLICPPLPDGKAIVRSFLTSPGQNKMALLTREIMLTMASLGTKGRTGTVKVYDVTGKIDYKILTEQTGLDVEALNLAEKITLQEQQENVENLDLIIAAGAGAALAGKTDKVDFRADFMPYQGKRAALEKTIKIVSTCLVVLFIALGILMQMQYYKTYKDYGKIQNKFKADFIIAMPGSTFPKSNEAVRRLKSEINRMKDVKSGLISASGEESIEAKLTYLFEALNSVPKNVDIDIDRIAVTTKTMSITGSTSGGGYLQLFGAIDKHPKLARGQSNYTPKEGRDNFMLTVVLKGKAE
jgi:preprotein translocase subunit SecG